jgi:uncharacterized protein (TIGR03067 family)
MARKTYVSSVFLLWLLGALGCARPTLEEKLKPFQGTWAVVSLNRAGKDSDDAALKNITVLIEKDRLRLFELKGGGPAMQVSVEEYLVQMDPLNTSGDVDLVCYSGDNAGLTRLGIFAREDDKLKLCLAEVGGPRPTEFAGTASPPVTLIVLRPKEE